MKTTERVLSQMIETTIAYNIQEAQFSQGVEQSTDRGNYYSFPVSKQVTQMIKRHYAHMEGAKQLIFSTSHISSFLENSEVWEISFVHINPPTELIPEIFNVFLAIKNA
ncbi:hypothetical protein KIN20_004699 [Parelaphostrongylus tenuis]|uniref:Uncharacterized protein n=1 Tax=Parelaphostrongylus tenuis TaxID=148309 RepID=A0AAD5QJJ2_PARTN|nr:hypothetical protein KIN20_004699 [Parelaphostrongylus tenuis]